jgi:hypothetical protein
MRREMNAGREITTVKLLRKWLMISRKKIRKGWRKKRNMILVLEKKGDFNFSSGKYLEPYT